jgi:NAD(P)-dependent dehydrogenase (short-subunit alcohol dehydrogenase family)
MPLANPPALGTRMLPADTFKGQTVYVTGGGTGLGKAIAVEFARCGANVAIASRDEGHRAAGVAAVNEAGGHGYGTAVDVRSPEAIAKSFDEVEAALGPISILINNAAGNFAVPAERMSANAWNAVIGIVLNGTFFCSTELARRLIARKSGGAILNIGATYSWTGGPIASHSAAAKAAVTNLTQSLAVEWAADDIRVNCLAPGLFPSADRSEHAVKMMQTTAGSPSVGAARSGSTVPGGRVGETRELGWAATYMCSPFAAYLSGHTLVLDAANWLRRYGLGMPEFEPPREVFDRRQAATAAASES